MSQAAITILAAAIGVFGSLLGAVVGGVTSYCAELKLRERRRSRQALKEIEERIKGLHSEVVHTYVNGITGDEEVDAVEIRAEALEIVKMSSELENDELKDSILSALLGTFTSFDEMQKEIMSVGREVYAEAYPDLDEERLNRERFYAVPFNWAPNEENDERWDGPANNGFVLKFRDV